VLPGPHKRYAEASDTIRALNEAVLEHRCVRIEYTTGRTGETSVRDLDPYRVWYRSGGLYVIGHDHKSDEVRTFAVDRIGRATLLGAHFEVPADFDFEARTASAFGVVAERPETVCIRFAPRWALYVQEHEWHPSQRSAKTEDGGVELTMEVGLGEELRGWVLSFGAGAEVLAPDSLRAEVAEELARAGEQYREG
jgi:predicted DNA-binding transcriptional regulator YafY